MFATLARFARDRAGAFAPIGVLVLVIAIGMAAIAIDVGRFHLARRTLQTTADLAAIAAAENIGRARAAAAATVVASGENEGALVAVELGRYEADRQVSPENRFTVAGSEPTAVRVRLRTSEPMVFAGVLRRIVGLGETTAPPPASGATATEASDRVEIEVAAVAAVARFASLSLGSRLIGLEGGILNGLLGALLGTEVSLSVLDYRALATAKVDLFTFARALSTRLDLGAVSYDSLLATDVRLGDVLAAAAEAARTEPDADATAISALVRLAGATGAAGTTVDLSRLVDFGPYGGRSVDGKPLIGAHVDALGLVDAIAQLANGRHQLALDVDAGLSGIVQVGLKVAIGERPVDRPWFAIGRTSLSVHTAQTRLLFDVRLLGEGAAALVHLPLYLELAAATATVRDVDCGAGAVVVAARPAVVDAWIGTVGEAAMANMAVRPQPAPATLVDILSLIRIKGRANVTVGNLRDADVTFSARDIESNLPKTVTTRNFLGSLTSGLIETLVLTVDGVPLLPLDPLRSLLAGILVKATAPVDTLLGQTLGLLGVGVGQADVWVHGTRCEGAVLVN